MHTLTIFLASKIFFKIISNICTKFLIYFALYPKKLTNPIQINCILEHACELELTEQERESKKAGKIAREIELCIKSLECEMETSSRV